jgi:hypothetical protein
LTSGSVWVHLQDVAGEEPQKLGDSGLQRAKQWLDASTRVKGSYTQTDYPYAELLHFPWPKGSREPFSFDLGGTFRGEVLEGQSFVAEVKNYKAESNLPVHFRNFLAKCYVALGHRPKACDNFLWISWAPFQAKVWDRHATAENVRKAVLHPDNIESVFGVTDQSDALQQLDAERTVKVADRVWLITLCTQQERLVLTTEHFVEVTSKILAKEKGFAS